MEHQLPPIEAMMHHWIAEELLSVMLKSRETCHHWIDYEIYDSLSEDLKKKYLSQITAPQFIYSKSKGELKFKPSIRCKANHFDKPHMCSVDCSKQYPKSIKYFKKLFGKKFIC